MIQSRSVKKASQWGAFFVLWLLFCGALWADACEPFHADEWVQVAHVYDADTVKLRDGRKIRLIGINAPEIGRDGRPSDALAVAARDALRQWLADEPRLALRYDAETTDRYGRVLAHAYLADQRSVEVRLLEQGLAAAVVITPNIVNLRCYQNAEALARQRGRGIWAYPRYLGITAKALAQHGGGFYVVEALVERVGESRKAVWLNLTDKLVARIDKRDDVYFEGVLDLKALAGKKIKLRGWWASRRGGLQMRLYHPAMLEVL